MTNTLKLLPCPFCDHDMEMTDLKDALHPSGVYWRVDKGIRHYIRHPDRKPTDIPCWTFSCLTHEGGCGVTMNGDSRDEVINRWNRRV